MNAPFDVVWDMETNDPDDFLTLLLLAAIRSPRCAPWNTPGSVPERFFAVSAQRP